MNIEEKYNYAVDILSHFDNYLEIEDFRQFLLLILNLDSMGPEAMLRQLGMGPKGKTTLPYNPEKKLYFTKIMSGLTLNNQLTIYHRSEKVSDKFVHNADSEIFTKYLTEYERKNLLPPKFMIITPEVHDFTDRVLIETNSPKPSTSGIESLYGNLAELIVTQGLKFVFLIEAEKADIVFTMNMSVEPTHHSENSIQYFDVYIDEKKELRNHTFIRMKNEDIKEGNLEIEFINDIKEISHSEMFDSHFTIIVPIKSMQKP